MHLSSMVGERTLSVMFYCSRDLTLIVLAANSLSHDYRDYC